MPSTLAKLANTIHIRDFVDYVLADRTRPQTGNYVEIHTDVNVFQEDEFYDSGITVEPIHTCIHAYLTESQRDLYVTDAFFYAQGRFSAAVTTENKLEITVKAFGLQRHPGDVSSFDDYRSHLPERWCPMLTVMGCVGYRNPEPIEPSRLRHFELQTSVYDSSKKAPVNFSVMCYFSSDNRWENFNVPNTGAYVSVTAKVVGRSTKENRLAVRVLDISYTPRSFGTPLSPLASTPLTSSKRKSPCDGGAESTTPSTKERRWDYRVDSTPLSKKSRYSVPEADLTVNSEGQSPRTPPGQLLTISQHHPASSPIDGNISSTSTITSQISDGGRRSLRNSRPSK